MSRRSAIPLAIVLLSVLLSPLRRELFVGDETKYTQVVREMRAGSFFMPTLGGAPFTHKPPLHFWIVDLLTVPFGVYSIWPFVIPSLVAFALLLWLMARWGGPPAAFVCGTSALIWYSAQSARMDVQFALLLALAAWCIERFFDRDERAMLVWAAVATGVAFLVKGPMAPLISICLVAFEAIRRRRLPRGPYAAATLALFGIPLLWLVPAILVGGEPFWREIFYKQTVGRAVSSWVHRAPPWFYLLHAPGTLMPWFPLLLAAIVAVWKRADERSKFAVSWMLAVLVPYSLLSSKLDVYMISMIPAVALTIGRFVAADDDRWSVWGRRANAVTQMVMLLIGIAGLVVQPSMIREPEGALVARLDVRAMFAVLLIGAAIGLFLSLRRSLQASTVAVGLTLVATFVWAAVVLAPIANEVGSTRPLVRALLRQQVPAPEIALFVCPHLWTRGMPPELAKARHVDPEDFAAFSPRVIVARRKDAGKIAPVLTNYRKVDELRMIGKWFDVYRR